MKGKARCRLNSQRPIGIVRHTRARQERKRRLFKCKESFQISRPVLLANKAELVQNVMTHDNKTNNQVLFDIDPADEILKRKTVGLK